MAGRFAFRQSGLDRRHPTDEQSFYKNETFSEYLDTPYLTGLINVCTMLGVFIGAWTMIILIGDIHHGFRVHWQLILIIVIDLVINFSLR